MAETALTEAELQKLVLEAQEGSAESFGQIYDHYFESVYRYVTFRVQDEMSEDIVADIFVKAWEKLGTYKPQKNVPFGAWLFRIARHTLIDAYRSQEQIEEVPEEMEDGDALNRADTRVKRRHFLQIVRASMSDLPERYQEVLQLTFIADLPTSEVARVLKLKEGAVRILKHRALRKLEQNLPPEIQDFA